jgi:hypothetical protein
MLLKVTAIHSQHPFIHTSESHCTYPAAIAAFDESFQLQADLSHMKLFSNEKPSPRSYYNTITIAFSSLALHNMVEAFPIIQ